jgi:predicted peroxiredoxin
MLDTVTQTSRETSAQVTHKIAIVIYSNVTTEALSRAYRAFGFAAELLAAGDDVTIVFDGGGSATLAAVLDPRHDLHRAWSKVAPALRGVCGYCAKAYDVQDTLKAAGIPMLTYDHGHASLRTLLDEGRQIITF